jgi:hypothetical protein
LTALYTNKWRITQRDLCVKAAKSRAGPCKVESEPHAKIAKGAKDAKRPFFLGVLRVLSDPGVRSASSA